jgi:thioesterase domain-containing protein/NAD(P)-dependent dehydrogenase (short-subunit alcohol dehydrogenase family)/acyl carrier protein
VSHWFSVPSWRRSIPSAQQAEGGPWLLFGDEVGLAAGLESRLSSHPVVVVTPGPRFARLSDTRYSLRPGQLTDYESLFEQLDLEGRLPRHVVHLWTIARKEPWTLRKPRGAERLRRFDATKELAFDSLLLLAQVLGHRETPVTLTVVSNDLFDVPGHPSFAADRALLLGPVRVIPRELHHLRVRVVDVSLRAEGEEARARVQGQLLAELLSETASLVVAYRAGERWVESLDAVLVPASSPSTPTLRPEGTYVITGGLGGIGLALAGHLARSTKVNLVLLGRAALPTRAEWSSWLDDHPAEHPTAKRLRAVRAIEETGSAVLCLAADVTDPAQVDAALAAARARFGAIHGVIHAAGTIDDGLLALKGLDSATAVIATKAKGALILDDLLRRDRLDFFIVFSSVSARLGLEGQIDYTAANAFLDAFAEQRTAAGRGRTVSIGWSTWQTIGMAAALTERRPAGRSSPRAGLHAMRSDLESTSEHGRVFRTRVSLAEHWLVAEHVLRTGEAVMPGTGYLELVRAAFTRNAQREDGAAVRLEDVVFLSPFTVARDAPKDLYLKLAPHENGKLDFAFWSRREDLPHASGRISFAASTPCVPEDLEGLRAQCDIEVPVVDGFLAQPFVDFGPRWGNVERIRRGKGVAVLDLRLPLSCEGDLAEHGLHPALLDMATGGAQHLIADFDPERDFYVPLSYRGIHIRGALPRAVVSRVRLLPGNVPGLARFEVTIFDCEGRPLVEIADFTMKRLDTIAAFSSAPQETASVPSAALAASLRQGITPSEGMEAFDRVLRSPLPSRVFVSSVDLPDWLAHIDESARAATASIQAGGTRSPTFARPNLSTTFVAPRDEVERELAAMWQEMLGVARVGIHDDFFELGGQSLVAVRMFGKIRDRYHVDLPLSTLFEAPTIAGAAKIVREEANLPKASCAKVGGVPAAREPPLRALRKSTRWHSLVPMQTQGSLPPFFCVAGMGGTLNNLRKLALLVGDTRPFYGLQPPGVDDARHRLYRVEALAAYYIEQVRTLRPAGPYFLGGYSGGGVVAFEMARQLADSGEEIAFVGLIDSFSPHLPLRPLAERAHIHLKRAEARGPSYLVDTMERRLFHESSQVKRHVARLLGYVFPMRYRYQNIEDSWLTAERHYQPAPWSGRATLFRAREESALSLWTAFRVDEQHGWTRYLRGGVEVQLCPGNHATMCEEPHVGVLAARLRDAVERAGAGMAQRQAAE